MPVLRNSKTGVIVDVSADRAEELGSGYVPVKAESKQGGDSKPARKTNARKKTGASDK